jgi:signal transduction histidine kinase
LKKTALIFLLAIFLPALILGALALRTASQQRIILEQQEAELRQAETDRLAAAIRSALFEEQQRFSRAVQELVARDGVEEAARKFATELPSAWPRKAIGFAVTTGGQILSPTPQQAQVEAPAREFLKENRLFIGGEIAAQVYQSPAPDHDERSKADRLFAGKTLPSRGKQQPLKSERAGTAVTGKPGTARERQDVSVQMESSRSSRSGGPPADQAPAVSTEPERFAWKDSQPSREEEKSQAMAGLRKVAPQKVQSKGSAPQMASQLNVATSRFSQLVRAGSEGILARFIDDSLEMIFWARPAVDDQIVFGAQINPADLRDLIEPLLHVAQPYSPSFGSSQETCTAVLDDRASPFALSSAGFSAQWKRPFVATEIGEALPHWEVALYLTDPARLTRSARLVNLTLIGLIAIALAAIVWGSFLVVADTRRQLALVRKKTDFVSNVSHELKTPLTSIRMFAELLHEKRVQDPEKVASYLRIITLESERLTRLINNVLDFARLERGEKRYQKRPFDLHALLGRLWEGQEMHLRAQGFETAWHAGSPPYRVFGDEDALAQVIVNLLSNAEKYSGAIKSIELHSYVDNGRVIVSVLDRGSGVPAGEERKIFEHFYRAHDSLSSGVQGSGLGLTLAQKIAADHGGTIRYTARKGGGSNFTLDLPAHSANGADAPGSRSIS